MLVAFDYETVELTPDGPVASTEAYRPNFRVDSMALCFEDMTTEFIEGEDAVKARLVSLSLMGARFIAHNYQFERLVTACRFPDVNLNYHADTMRLAQLFDNGGDDSAFEYIVDDEQVLEEGDLPNVKRKPISGLGLVVCNKRILGASGSHKDEAYAWLQEHYPKSKGKEGQHLHLLPRDIYERYNIADAVVTMQLYKYITERFAAEKFDWQLDWQLFSSTVNHISDSKARGVPINRGRLHQNHAQVAAEVVAIEQAFRQRFVKEIANIQMQKAVDWVLTPKTARGQKNRYQQFLDRKPTAVKATTFNIGSNKQLAQLFVDTLKIKPQFFTDKGSPSFKSAMLSQWGDGGEMLKTRRKRFLVLQQMTALLELSEYDDKWHVDLRAAGTSTGRMAGGRA